MRCIPRRVVMTNSCDCCCCLPSTRRVFEVFFVTTATRASIHFADPLVRCRFRNSSHFAGIPGCCLFVFRRSGMRNVGGVSVPCQPTCMCHFSPDLFTALDTFSCFQNKFPRAEISMTSADTKEEARNRKKLRGSAGSVDVSKRTAAGRK